MTYTTAEGRAEILDGLAAGIEQIDEALALLTEAYERLDEDTGDRLEDLLFRPVQAALARARRTASEFTARYTLPARPVTEPAVLRRAEDARDAIARAGDALEGADGTLAELQDGMLPVEVGDAELRAGLAEVRTILGPLPRRTAELIRTLGR